MVLFSGEGKSVAMKDVTYSLIGLPGAAMQICTCTCMYAHCVCVCVFVCARAHIRVGYFLRVQNPTGDSWSVPDVSDPRICALG